MSDFLKRQKEKQNEQAASQTPPSEGEKETEEIPQSRGEDQPGPGEPLPEEGGLILEKEEENDQRQRIKKLESENHALKVKVRNLQRQLARKNIGRR